MSKDTLFIDNGNDNILENVLDNGREYKVLELLKQEPSITGKAMAEKDIGKLKNKQKRRTFSFWRFLFVSIFVTIRREVINLKKVRQNI